MQASSVGDVSCSAGHGRSASRTGCSTLPVEIWTLLRSGLNPKANAIGALVFGVSILLVVLAELAIFGKGKRKA